MLVDDLEHADAVLLSQVFFNYKFDVSLQLLLSLLELHLPIYGFKWLWGLF